MYRNLLLYFLMIHVIGDFYFRPRKLPGYRDILVKNFCYTLLFLIASIPFWRIHIFVAILVVVFFHLILEIVEHFFKELGKAREIMIENIKFPNYYMVINSECGIIVNQNNNKEE